MLQDQHAIKTGIGQRPATLLAFLREPCGGLVFEQGHFNRRLERTFFEWLEDITKGIRLAALDGRGVGMGGQIDEGQTEVPVQGLCGFQPVHPALELDIHQNHVGPGISGHGNSLFATACLADDRITQLTELNRQVSSHNRLVLHNQNGAAVHESREWTIIVRRESGLS